MKKVLFGLCLFVIAGVSTQAAAQPSHAFVWCNWENECEIFIGSDHASAWTYDGRTTYYLLDQSDFDFDPRFYMAEGESETEVTTLHLGEIEDMYQGYTNKGVCIGRNCGKHTLNLPAPISTGRIITKIVVTGHDKFVPDWHARLALYDGNRSLGTRDVKKAGADYTWYVNRKDANLRLKSLRDETVITKIKIYTKAYKPKTPPYSGTCNVMDCGKPASECAAAGGSFVVPGPPGANGLVYECRE